MSFRGKKTRWVEPQRGYWRHQPSPFQFRPIFQQITADNGLWFGPPNPPVNSRTPPPPGTEDDSKSADEQPQTGNMNHSFENGHPPHMDRPCRNYNLNSRERWRPHANHRPPHRHWRGRGGTDYQNLRYLPPQRYTEPERYYEDGPFNSHLVLSNDNTYVEPDKAVDENPRDKTDDKPILGSVEEREKIVKEKSEWLKNKLKNKDLSDVEMRLQQMRQQKASEQSLSTNEKTLYIPASTDNSALKADSIETVKKNLADILPDDPNLLNSLLKDPEMKTRTSRCVNQNCGRDDEEKIGEPRIRSLRKPITEESQTVVRKETVDPRRRSSIIREKKQIGRKSQGDSSDGSEYSQPAFREAASTYSSPTARPNLSVSRSKTSEFLPVPVGDEKKKENLLECVSKLAGIPKMKDMSQLKSLIENPRPGKFEYYLKEQIKKYRLASCRAVYLSGEPFTNIENVDIVPVVKSEESGDDFLLSSLGRWYESVNMEDLPFAIVQELGELLDLDFSNPADIAEEVPAEEIIEIIEEPPIPEGNSLAIEPYIPPRPIRIKDFARYQTPTPVKRRDNSAVRRCNAQEADTTVALPAPTTVAPSIPTTVAPSTLTTEAPSAVPHPLSGPTLMESVCPLSTSTVSPSTANVSKSSFPQTGPFRGRRPNLLPQDVFYSGENCGKKKGKSKNKSPEIVRSLLDTDANSNAKAANKQGRKLRGSADDTEESQLEEPAQLERGRLKGSRRKMCANNSSVSEFTDEEERPDARTQGCAAMDEPQILARLQEICVEIKRLEKEKAYLYSLLPLARENLKRKHETSSDESDGESERQKIFADMVAGLQQSTSSEKSIPTSKKKSLPRKAKCGGAEDRVVPRKAVAKGTVAFFTNNITLTCKKPMLPKDMGIITQIKVIRKSIIAASANGKIYSVSSSTGKLKKTYDLGVFPVKCFTLAQIRNGTTLLIGGTENGHLHCFKLLSGEKVTQCKVTNDINCIDSSWYSVYIGSKSGSIAKFLLDSRKIEALAAENGPIYTICCAVEGPRKVLVCASSRNGIEVRSAKDALVLRRIVTIWDNQPLGAPEYKVAIDVNVNKVCYTKTGEVHVTEFTSPENTVRHKISTHVSCMRLCNGVLFVGCKDGTIRRFDVKTNEVLEPLTGNRENVVCMDIVDDKVILARKGGVFDIINLNKSPEGADSVEEL